MCSICLDKCDKAIITSCCNQLFCLKCNLYCLKEKLACALCRTTIDSRNKINIVKNHLELKENKTNETERLFLKAHSLSKTIQQKEVIETGLAQLYQQIGNFQKSFDRIWTIHRF